MILVVEDTPVFRKFVCTLLGDALSVPVREADSGEAALPLATPQTLVVTDLQMPGMGGIELIRSLRAEASCQGVPIVAMSADPDARSGAAALGAGANAFFAKPFDPQEFVSTVSALLAPASPAGP
jgi:two-component system chemotaxis response regulator CheY